MWRRDRRGVVLVPPYACTSELSAALLYPCRTPHPPSSRWMRLYTLLIPSPTHCHISRTPPH